MKRFLIFPLLAISLFAQSGYVSVVKTIPVSAWQLGAGSGIVQLPDGSQAIGAGYGSSFSVDLGVTPAQLQADPAHLGNFGYAINGIYRVKFSVENQLTVYPGYDTVKVSFGTQELCEASIWGMETFFEVPMICLGPRYLVNGNSLPGGGAPQGRNNLVVTVTVNDGSANGGWPLYFKNVSLTFTPSN